MCAPWVCVAHNLRVYKYIITMPNLYGAKLSTLTILELSGRLLIEYVGLELELSKQWGDKKRKQQQERPASAITP